MMYTPILAASKDTKVLIIPRHGSYPLAPLARRTAADRARELGVGSARASGVSLPRCLEGPLPSPPIFASRARYFPNMVNIRARRGAQPRPRSLHPTTHRPNQICPITRRLTTCRRSSRQPLRSPRTGASAIPCIASSVSATVRAGSRGMPTRRPSPSAPRHSRAAWPALWPS